MIGLKYLYQFKVYSLRKYGQPKLPKPIELKGIKQLLSVDYIINEIILALHSYRQTQKI